ncbi:dihydropteroate synthase, partial [Streptomyces pseudogriseolus]
RERDAATAAVTALAAQAGAWAVRVHEVRASADAVRVVRAIQGARPDDRPTSPEHGAEGAR